jgi:hypothetical protein
LHYKIVLSIFVFYSPLHGTTALTGQGLLIFAASRSHSDTPYSVGLLWTSDQPDAETSMSPAEFETATPESERPLGSAVFSTNVNIMLETSF